VDDGLLIGVAPDSDSGRAVTPLTSSRQLVPALGRIA
jgi:hypothetical protein